MNKKQKTDLMKSTNMDIYRSIANYVMGPKMKGLNYAIEKNNKSVYYVIRVTGKSKSHLYIYFGKHIRIQVVTYSVNVNENVYYSYFEYQDELPEDLEEYKQTTKVFLMELIRHICCLNYTPESYPFVLNENIGEDFSFTECSKLEKPGAFNVFEYSQWYDIMENIALYPYSYEDKQTVEYITDIFKSKKFKRFRGDNK